MTPGTTCADLPDPVTAQMEERLTDEDDVDGKGWYGLTQRCATATLGFLGIFVLLGKEAAPVMENRVATAVSYFSARSPAACTEYILIYSVATCLGAPSTFFEVLAGFLFGWRLGVCLDTVSRVLSATASFVVARSLLSCGRGGMSHPWLEGVGEAVEEQGLPFLILFNLLYIPVAIKNYGLGFIPQVSLSNFIAAILCVELPLASIWAYVGAAARAQGLGIRGAESAGSRSPFGLAALAVAFVALLLVFRVLQQKVSVVLRKRIRHAQSVSYEREGMVGSHPQSQPLGPKD